MFSIGIAWTNVNRRCQAIQRPVVTPVQHAMIRYFHQPTWYRRLPMCCAVVWKRPHGDVMNLAQFWYAKLLRGLATAPLNRSVHSNLNFSNLFAHMAQKPNTTFSDTSISAQFQSPGSNTPDDNMTQKNSMNSLSSSNASKTAMAHESPKDHSINIETAAPYYQGITELQSINRQFVTYKRAAIMMTRKIDFEFILCLFTQKLHTIMMDGWQQQVVAGPYWIVSLQLVLIVMKISIKDEHQPKFSPDGPGERHATVKMVVQKESHSSLSFSFSFLPVCSHTLHRRLYVPPSRPPWRRTWFIVMSGVVIFIFIIYIMASLGRRNNSYNNDSDNDYPHNWFRTREKKNGMRTAFKLKASSKTSNKTDLFRSCYPQFFSICLYIIIIIISRFSIFENYYKCNEDIRRMHKSNW